MSHRPVLIGIVGDSGSGKSTMARGIRAILGPNEVMHLCTDDYHRFDRAERAERAERGLTPLHPIANHLDILQLDLERLKRDEPILKPVYDHATGTLQRPEYLRPRAFIIVEGLLCFHEERSRALFDVSVFLDPAESVRREWKRRRDTTRRGYAEAELRADLDRRERDAADYIRPQRQYADIVVQFAPPATAPVGHAGPELDARLVLRPPLEHPDLSDLIGQRAPHGAELRLELGRDEGRPVDVLEIDHRVDRVQARALEAAIWHHLPGRHPTPHEQFGHYQHGVTRRHSDQLALVQLLLTYHLLTQRGQVSDAAAPRFTSALAEPGLPAALHSATP